MSDELKELVNRATTDDKRSILYLKHDPYKHLKSKAFILQLRRNEKSKTDQLIVPLLKKIEGDDLDTLHRNELDTARGKDSYIPPIADPRIKRTFMTDGGFAASAPLQRMQMDLAYMSWTKPKKGKKRAAVMYQYLLVIVDIESG